jgi:hypothetical protein
MHELGVLLQIASWAVLGLVGPAAPTAATSFFFCLGWSGNLLITRHRQTSSAKE